MRVISLHKYSLYDPRRLPFWPLEWLMIVAHLPGYPLSPEHGKPRSISPSRLLNVLGSGQWSEDVVPTVAFNLRQVRKGNVTMKVWDVAVSTEAVASTNSPASPPKHIADL